LPDQCSMAEDAMTRQTGIEYVVQTENGALLTIVQGPQPAFSITQTVLVIYGNQARVVADPAG
jgi:outer membrane lipoprotein SlyB